MRMMSMFLKSIKRMRMRVTSSNISEENENGKRVMRMSPKRRLA